ncbi:hypothetical protein [Denitromonas halophila]|uniref:Uncharacterized protein n=1 Tax=Denitromonas halophila TaxID=1629404 RepID=A0A557R2T7_9RHOO|nr:hypothetical protein [Denitromonas halophila]TVO59448.1 hypothetical protein FHP91_01670 [Denitromonas halophila]
MTIRGVFHALPPKAFGNRIRTRDDLAQFVSGTHAVAAKAQLDLTDAGDSLAALCERLALPDAIGVQPLTIPKTAAARYIPAYRLPDLADRIDAVAPGALAKAISRRDIAAATDKGNIARQFLQLKRFYRDCATHQCDVLFVQHLGKDSAPSAD